MNTKLTLTINDSVVKSAKRYAKSRRKSLSRIVEHYLQSVSAKAKNEEEISPRILRLKGSVSLPDDFDYKTELRKSLVKKYNRK
jgi:hypothetical protein